MENFPVLLVRHCDVKSRLRDQVVAVDCAGPFTFVDVSICFLECLKSDHTGRNLFTPPTKLSKCFSINISIET